MLLQKYLELVNDLYTEPRNEEILGSFMIPCKVRKKERISKQNKTTQGADRKSKQNKIMNFKEISSQKKAVLVS